ncbi:MAG: hypothetical protein JOY61_26590 [Chloroflexi bacterium]|nr:hypothetical protein [Chloroflexota bacterium]
MAAAFGNQALQRLAQTAPTNALALQAARAGLGNRATQRLLNVGAAVPVQRYYDTDTFLPDAEAQFVTQPVKPEVVTKDNAPEKELPYAVQYPPQNTPRSGLHLLVADDSSMAIQNVSAEPKEFYALPQIVTTSNAKLDDVGSSFRLYATSGTVTVRNHTLSRIRPVNIVTDDDAKRLTSMIENICIKISGHVIGTKGGYSRSVVLGQPDDSQRLAEISPGPTGDPKLARLARYMLTHDQISKAEAEEAMLAKDPIDVEAWHEQYGRASGKGELNAKAQALGINQFAAPAVGQGLGTFGMSAQKPTLDYSKMLDENTPTERESTWGYHFAGVVAQAIDAPDYVTLENYNRGDDILQGVRKIHVQVLSNYASAAYAWYMGLSLAEKDDDDAVRKKFGALAAEITGRSGVHEYFRIQAEAKPDEKWFFRMYGNAPGQSFHERQAASGEFVNPITVTVRKNDLWLNRLREERARIVPQIDATKFTAGEQANWAPRVMAARQAVADNFDEEIRQAGRYVSGQVSNTRVVELKVDMMVARGRLFNNDHYKTLRQDLRTLLQTGVDQDRQAALAILNAFADLNSPRWFE